ncbi:FAD dependent oxidoreductase family protein [Paraburkholderia xenovorans LB400]|uniref:FAD-dependent pyridine nucleotide-disulfide oxidoreductase n=1 Tax=Paraburkholderia xenovorans (strain LB400) TaxID=266265 RepID=Q13GG3_PARXL|nr:FAD-dependent oxidoreductase [Paraburkholderia xenovorans]ABE36826.1 Putative FAD-dependent pyridine nucleotide- disulfide oxidoreductase [Paraburkholderia xenovorans LB400]AIP35137.1 FAD dependent oxidoreductase family protein [Paraburkholderia xenovorans LB400]
MRIVIVGAGQAGGWVARALRDEGFTGQITLVGEEAHPPYQRPPLSKEVLLGDVPPEHCYLWPAGLDAELRLNTRVRSIDRSARQLRLADGGTIAYDRLCIATGGRVRRLDMPGAHYLRTIDDALALRAALLRGGSVLVIGGGWIGLEAAAAARRFGCSVTVVEAAARLCSRVVPPMLSEYLHGLHHRNGVTIACNATPDVAAHDTIIVGIGIVPNTELAEDAGLEVANGIVVDEYGTTSDADIFAVGDVAALNGQRIESWANAQNQAIATARSMLGKYTPYSEIPWFWSNQYDVNLQFLGFARPEDEVVVRGDVASDRFSLFFLSSDRISAMIAANSMKDIRAGKRLIERGISVSPDRLADPSQSLQDLLKA